MKKQLSYIKHSRELTQLNKPAKNILEANLKDKIQLQVNTNKKISVKHIQTQQKQFQSDNVTLYFTNNQIDLYNFKSYWYELMKKYNLDKSDMLLFNIYLNTFLYYLFSKIFGKKHCYILLLLWILPVTELVFLSKQNEFKLSITEKKLYYVQEQQKKINRRMFMMDGDIVLKSLYRRNSNTLLKYLDVYFKRFQKEYDIHQFINMNKFEQRVYSQFLGNIQQMLRLLFEVTYQSIEIL